MSESSGHVVVLAATTDIKGVDPALLRPGRLDRRIYVGRPGHSARHAIFQSYLCRMPLRLSPSRTPSPSSRENNEGSSAEGEVGQGQVGQEGKAAAATAGSASCLGGRPGGEGVGDGTREGRKVFLDCKEGTHDGGGEGGPVARGMSSDEGPCFTTVSGWAEWLAGETAGRTGAEVGGVCREAAMASLREDIEAREVQGRHFKAALGTLPQEANGGRRR
ncbi:unnamed protein product [Discosporangium mesarthrocarpum]